MTVNEPFVLYALGILYKIQLDLQKFQNQLKINPKELIIKESLKIAPSK